ncbi:MAG: biotin/lipoyl-containing protein, partial [Kiritimatiellia bacterium]
EAKEVEPMIPFCPMPGGALTANTQMLRDNGIMEKYPEIIRAMGEVVRKGGFGTSVTPVSQFYFQQAFNNVMMGPWKKIADGYGKMVLGYFGRTPTAPDPEVIRIASEQLKLEPTTRPVLELNDADPSKGIEPAKQMLRDAGITDLSDENIFIAATCKEKGIDFLLGNAPLGIRMKKTETEAAPAENSGPKRVTVNGRSFLVELSEGKAVVNGSSYTVSVSDGSGETAMSGGDSGGGGEVIKSQTPGKVFKLLVSEGDQVRKGQVMLILEAMKMEVDIQAPRDAQVTRIHVEIGGQVKSGQALLTLL